MSVILVVASIPFDSLSWKSFAETAKGKEGIA
jgi:hypothetical protein